MYVVLLLGIGWVLTRHHGINEGGLLKKKWDAHLQGYYILCYVRSQKNNTKKNRMCFYKSLESHLVSEDKTSLF